MLNKPHCVTTNTAFATTTITICMACDNVVVDGGGHYGNWQLQIRETPSYVTESAIYSGWGRQVSTFINHIFMNSRDSKIT